LPWLFGEEMVTDQLIYDFIFNLWSLFK